MAQFYTAVAVVGCMIAFCIHQAISNLKQRLVSQSYTALVSIGTPDREKADAEMGKSYGCRSPPRLLNQRPFGVDRLEQIFRANAESRLMELFLFHFRLWGTTLEQIFLGTRALGTIEPRNLEVILSTNFKGQIAPLCSLRVGELTTRRLEHGSKTKSHVSILRRWHIHPRRCCVEAFTRIIETSIRAQAI